MLPVRALLVRVAGGRVPVPVRVQVAAAVQARARVPGGAEVRVQVQAAAEVRVQVQVQAEEVRAPAQVPVPVRVRVREVGQAMGWPTRAAGRRLRRLPNGPATLRAVRTRCESTASVRPQAASPYDPASVACLRCRRGGCWRPPGDSGPGSGADGRGGACRPCGRQSRPGSAIGRRLRNRPPPRCRGERQQRGESSVTGCGAQSPRTHFCGSLRHLSSDLARWFLDG